MLIIIITIIKVNTSILHGSRGLERNLPENMVFLVKVGIMGVSARGMWVRILFSGCV